MALVKLRPLNNRFEADLLAQALTEAGVTFQVRTFEDTAYDGLFIGQYGWGIMWVEEEDLSDAKEIALQFDRLYGGAAEETNSTGE